MLIPFARISKIDGSRMILNLNNVVSVEFIPGNERFAPYYAITDVNDKTHLSDTNPFTPNQTTTRLESGQFLSIIA